VNLWDPPISSMDSFFFSCFLTVPTVPVVSYLRKSPILLYPALYKLSFSAAAAFSSKLLSVISQLSVERESSFAAGDYLRSRSFFAGGLPFADSSSLLKSEEYVSWRSGQGTPVSNWLNSTVSFLPRLKRTDLSRFKPFQFLPVSFN